jgi:hypothetical protein
VVAGRGAQGPGAQKHGVGAGPEQSHQESVGPVAAADHGPSGGVRAQSHYAVDGRDEVRVETAFGETQSSIQARELVGQVIARQLAVFKQDLERFELAQWSVCWTAWRNSVRSCGSPS